LIKHLTYRQKNKYFVYGFLLAVIVVYLLAIRNTVSLWNENSKLSHSILAQQSSQQKFDQIKNRSVELDGQINKYFTDSTSHDELLLKSVSELCQQEKVLLKDMPIIEKSKEGNYHIFTNKITIEGNYHGLLKVLHQLETQRNIGRIASADFKTYVDHKKKKEILMLIIYIQTIIS
jgi:hypothetical protein